jgi:hypothetical protein
MNQFTYGIKIDRPTNALEPLVLRYNELTGR